MSRWSVRLASDADAADLLALLESDDYPGDIGVLYTRRPNPYTSLLSEGDRVVYPVVTDNETGHIVGGGACVIRDALVGGEVRRVGYLTALKLLPAYRRRVPLMAPVYGFCREQTSEVALYYTTVLAENTAAQRLLERRRPGMPEYRPAGAYTTLCFRSALGPRTPHRLVRASEPLPRPELDLCAASDLPGTPWELRDRSGALLASALVWDQRATKQYIVTRYGGAYRRLRRLPTALLGYPRLPRPDAVAAEASVTGLWVRDWDAGLARTFLALLSRAHTQLDFLKLGVHDSHPLAGGLASVRAVRLASLLYTVHWDDRCLGLSGRPVGLDVALL